MPERKKLKSQSHGVFKLDIEELTLLIKDCSSHITDPINWMLLLHLYIS